MPITHDILLTAFTGLTASGVNLKELEKEFVSAGMTPGNPFFLNLHAPAMDSQALEYRFYFDDDPVLLDVTTVVEAHTGEVPAPPSEGITLPSWREEIYFDEEIDTVATGQQRYNFSLFTPPDNVDAYVRAEISVSRSDAPPSQSHFRQKVIHTDFKCEAGVDTQWLGFTDLRDASAGFAPAMSLGNLAGSRDVYLQVDAFFNYTIRIRGKIEVTFIPIA